MPHLPARCPRVPSQQETDVDQPHRERAGWVSKLIGVWAPLEPGGDGRRQRMNGVVGIVVWYEVATLRRSPVTPMGICETEALIVSSIVRNALKGITAMSHPTPRKSESFADRSSYNNPNSKQDKCNFPSFMAEVLRTPCSSCDRSRCLARRHH